MNRIVLAATMLAALCLPAAAQYSAPPNSGNAFKDTSMLKPPAGAKVAIYKFEDLECPACAHAYPIVHAAADRYKIPIVRHDFPLKMHIWSRDAAITARYLQDKVSPQVAEEFRGSVFAAQTSIASKKILRTLRAGSSSHTNSISRSSSILPASSPRRSMPTTPSANALESPRLPPSGS